MAQPGYSTSKLGKPSPHPFPSTTTTTYNQARQHLQSVRSRLSHTIQDYLSACKIMQKTCETWNNPSADREQALLSIDAELLALTVEETTMRQARDVLTDTRNRSKMVAPIYSLPSEILARIFSEAACHCTHETNYDNVPPILNPITLSGVCRQWRQVAITYQPLWMHIDLVVGRAHTEAGYFSPEIWKDRSGGAQLSVHVHQYPSHTDDDMDDEDSEDEASDDYTGFSLNNLGGPSLTSLLDASADASDQARQHLKSVRARLAHAIQDYVAACELLLTVCHASTTAPAQRERSKLAINAELLALAVEEARLRKAREVLTEARGQCRMVSPIQLLPSEILARIFLEAACHCTHEITYKYVSTTLNPVALSG
ncbi:hypothetical protein FRC07_002319, partial [Ceratobasidium sp. 392]